MVGRSLKPIAFVFQRFCVKDTLKMLAVLALLCCVTMLNTSCFIRKDIDLFLHYAGPVKPLMASGDTEGIAVKRHAHFDFAVYDIMEKRIEVTDSYILKNNTKEDKTIELIYPFSSCIKESGTFMPFLTVNGESPEVKLLIGEYTGGFGSFGEKGRTSNPAYIRSWEAYQDLLGCGQYFERARKHDTFIDEKVTVCTFYNITRPEEYKKVDIAVFFDLPQDSVVITCGMKGASVKDEKHIYLFDSGTEYQVIILGEPPSEFTFQGYENYHYNTKIEGVSVNVKIETMLFSKVIQEHIRWYMEKQDYHQTVSKLLTEELALYTVTSMFKYTVLGEEPVDRYRWIMLDSFIGQSFTMGRVLYITAQTTIPAGQSIDLQCHFTKGASYDFPGAELRRNKGVSSYDMMLHIASNLEFIEQKASVNLPQNIDIVRQDFGFDPAQGITEVSLDMKKERYYIDIKEYTPEEE